MANMEFERLNNNFTSKVLEKILFMDIVRVDYRWKNIYIYAHTQT